MNAPEGRIRKEFGGMLINMRKPGEAVIIGGDTAVMIVRVIGSQVRIGVASKTQQSVLREEKYRENQEARRAEGAKTFHPFHRTGKGYSLSPTSDSAEVTEPVQDVTIARFDSLLEAYAFAEGVRTTDPEAHAEVERQHRDAFVLVHRPASGPFRFLDYSRLLVPTAN